MVNHALRFFPQHVFIYLLGEFWDILRVTEVEFIRQWHTIHHLLLPGLDAFFEYLMNWSSWSRRDVVLHRHLGLMNDYLLGLGRMSGNVLIDYIDEHHRLIILNIGNLIKHLNIIVFESIVWAAYYIIVLLLICLYLAFILLWTNWFRANFANFRDNQFLHLSPLLF